MSGELDVDSFEKAINGLNENLGQVGLLFKANMPLIGSEATQETKENCIDKMSLRIEALLDNFRESYEYYHDFYEKIEYNVVNETMEKEEEYQVFFQHAKQTFPKYIEELGQSMDSMTGIPIKTKKFNDTMAELDAIIGNICHDFQRTIGIIDIYNLQKQQKGKNDHLI